MLRALWQQLFSRRSFMGIPRKKGKTLQISDNDYEQSVEDLADAVIENLVEPEENALEPFEVYVQRMRIKVCSEAYHFKLRFSKGYQVLMSELSKKDPSKE